MNTTDTNEKLETAEELLKQSYKLLYDILMQIRFCDRVDHDGWILYMIFQIGLRMLE